MKTEMFVSTRQEQRLKLEEIILAIMLMNFLEEHPSQIIFWLHDLCFEVAVTDLFIVSDIDHRTIFRDSVWTVSLVLCLQHQVMSL